MIVVDTNVLSELFRSKPDARVLSWFQTHAADLAITAVTLAELLAGIAKLPDGRRKDLLRDAIRSALVPFQDSDAILSFDQKAAVEYAEVLDRRGATGRPISTVDAQIAAICRVHESTCATRNIRDFEATGVDLINPWEA